MNIRKVISISVMLLLLLVFAIPVASKPTDSIIVNNADTVRQDSFNMSQNLLDLFVAVNPRIIVEFSDNLLKEELTLIPGELVARVSQVSDRIIMQFADNNFHASLGYPVALFNDSTAPLISTVTTDRCIINWTTDEFADSTVTYGAQSGAYPESVNDPLYTKQHAVTLSALIPGSIYYLKVSSTDRSGNTSTSSEYSCTATESIFLPIAVKSY
jgi:hypothetical protein